MLYALCAALSLALLGQPPGQRMDALLDDPLVVR